MVHCGVSRARQTGRARTVRERGAAGVGRALLALVLVGVSVGVAVPATAGPAPVVLILMENRQYSAIIGNAKAPYINGLAARGTLFTNYFAVTHPSLPNYLAITGGTTCSKSGSSLCTAPTIFTQLGSADAQEFAENETAPCSYKGTSSLYVTRHDAYASDSANRKLSPCGDFPYTHIDPAALPEFSFLTPNLCHDMHGDSTCASSVAAGDSWLSQHVPPLLSAGAIVILTWDEGVGSVHGGGQVATIEVGPGVPVGKNATLMNHYSVLAGMESYFGLPLLANAASASPMSIGT